MYPLPEDPNSPLPVRALADFAKSTDPVECIVRVYAVRAFQLQPSDPTGLADPYIELRFGDKSENNRKEYIPYSLSPQFGRCLPPSLHSLLGNRSW